jgi:hypothetical protein
MNFNPVKSRKLLLIFSLGVLIWLSYKVHSWVLFPTAIGFFLFVFLVDKYVNRVLLKIGLILLTTGLLSLGFNLAIESIKNPAGTYIDRYLDKWNIEEIIGVDIPDFNVVNTQITRQNKRNFEFDVIAEIEFKKPLKASFFKTLDSISNLPIPKDIKRDNSYFYKSLESPSKCWFKNDSGFKYSRNTDFGEYKLHSKDAYFNMTFKNNSRRAQLNFGNY